MPAPGLSSRTAVASTCAAEWRSTGSESASFSVRMRISASASIGSMSPTVSPFTTAASAAFASPWADGRRDVAAVERRAAWGGRARREA
jgi:hypothetical protein